MPLPSSTSSSSSSSSPPPPNPILSAYESFVSDTPLVTRYALTTFSISFVVSLFVPLSLAITNIPYFTVFKLEFYRVILSNFLCSSVLNLIFGFISFMDQGKRLEYSMGSTNFGLLLVSIGVGSNLIFTVLTWTFYVVTGHEPYMMHHCGGLWLLIFGIIALECSLAPAGSQKRLFLMDVPALYYPIALLALFRLFFAAGSTSSSSSSGGSLFFILETMPDLLSIGIGYGLGFGKLDFLKISVEKRRKLEAGVLRSLVGKIGWVTGPARADWVMIAPSTSSSASSSINSNSGRNSDEEQGWKPSVFRSGESTSSSNGRKSSSGGGGGGIGQKLGGGTNTTGTATRRSNATTSPLPHDTQNNGREALLAAAERRALEKKREIGTSTSNSED